MKYLNHSTKEQPAPENTRFSATKVPLFTVQLLKYPGWSNSTRAFGLDTSYKKGFIRCPRAKI